MYRNHVGAASFTGLTVRLQPRRGRPSFQSRFGPGRKPIRSALMECLSACPLACLSAYLPARISPLRHHPIKARLLMSARSCLGEHLFKTFAFRELRATPLLCALRLLLRLSWADHKTLRIWLVSDVRYLSLTVLVLLYCAMCRTTHFNWKGNNIAIGELLLMMAHPCAHPNLAHTSHEDH